MSASSPASSETVPTGGFAARLAIIAVAAIFGLTYSLAAALIALELSGQGLSEAVIGANAAMHAVGVLAMAVLLPNIAAALGLRRAVVTALAAAAVLLFAFPLLPVLWMWFVLRVLLGAASEALFVLSETWLNALSSEASRARTMAGYTAALSVGFAAGPLILSFVGSDGLLPFAIGAGLAGGAALMVLLMPGLGTVAFEKPDHANPLRYFRLAPIAMGATALNAGVETAGLTFLTLYAMQLGWAEAQATQLMASMMFGAIVLQLPIGWIGDKVNRERFIVVLAALSAAGALAWPWALSSAMATYALLFVWGGLFVGIYTMMLAIVGSRYSGSDLVGIYAAMGLFWGAGALIGPALSGLTMQVSTHGLVIFVALACALFALAAALLGRRSAAPAGQ